MTWRLEGDFSAVHALGAGMTAGEIVVDGPVGRHAGAGMRGGRLEVRGDAGDWLGAEMRGGVDPRSRRCGDHVGAAYAGSPRGMTGGTILIDGDAGDATSACACAAALIAVAGAAGDWLGMRMLAGTILVFGACGVHPGAAMRRGTIGLFGARSARAAPHVSLGVPRPAAYADDSIAATSCDARVVRRRSSLPRLAQARRRCITATCSNSAAAKILARLAGS